MIKIRCPEHEEKLRLFCETDQQLVCVICRNGPQHDGHKFKPIKESAILMRAELEKVVQFFTEDNKDIETMATLQNEELRKTKEKHKQVQDQMKSKFEHINKYIKGMEEEILLNLRKKENNELKKMTKTLKHLDSALSERKKIESEMKSAQDIADPDSFLKHWNDEVRFEVKKLKCGQQTHPSFLSEAAGLRVTPAALYLLPYESYMLFSVWEDMLEVIKQTLKNKSP